MAELKAVAVTGGKGGAGKSTIAVNLAALLSNMNYKVLLVDADVDNPNDYIYLGMKRREAGKVEIRTPLIDPSLCDGCIECVRICPTHALLGRKGSIPLFFEDSCLGCSLCAEKCPKKAIKDGKKEIGALYEGESDNIKMISAAIKPGEARSPLVAHSLVRFFNQIDKNQFDKIIIDTCPGVANPVIQALRLSEHALIVTEPTILGLNTMKLSFRAMEKLDLSFDVVINRADVPSGMTKAIEEEAERRGARIFRIPYDDRIIEAAVKGVPAVRRSDRIRQAFQEILREVFSVD